MSTNKIHVTLLSNAQHLHLLELFEALNAFVGCSHAHDDGGAELFICSDCGSVEERHAAPDPINMPAGFVIERSVVEHFGHCGNCKH